jgi:hypothetical protein
VSGLAATIALFAAITGDSPPNDTLVLFSDAAVYEAVLSNVDAPGVGACSLHAPFAGQWQNWHDEIVKRAFAAEAKFGNDGKGSLASIHHRYDEREYLDVVVPTHPIWCDQASVERKLDSLRIVLNEFERRAAH